MSVPESLVTEACQHFGVTEVRPLTDGGQKTVRLVQSEGTLLVLKVLSVGSSAGQSLQRAVREVQLLQAVQSGHVVKVASDLVELGSPPCGAAWLEEYLEGEDLTNLVSSRWSWASAAEMGVQVARGLAALHELRVVHRDLSANNIRCLPGPRYKILDPGYARHELLPAITVLGHPGTYGFMSPEHLQTPPAGPTAFSDVFALGCLLWLALTGAPPIPYRGDPQDYGRRLAAGDVEGRHALGALTPEARDFLDRCLHRQPARRFPNGQAVAAALEGLQ